MMTSSAPASDTPTPPDAPTGPLLTFRSGGWVILLMVVIALALATWGLSSAVLRAMGVLQVSPGDGRDVATYGFVLQPAAADLGVLVPATRHRDMVPVMDDPEIVRYANGAPVVEDGDEETADALRKYLVSADRVIGVTIGGESRAYPISVMNVHEIVNDTLGGVPIAVTYSWPTDSAVVFDRRRDGETLAFGHSGLVHNSNLVMYDRRPGVEPHDPQPGATLWSQLGGGPIAGPGATADAAPLTVIPSVVTNWQTWLADHPETSAILRDSSLNKRRYKLARPDSYTRKAEVVYPVEHAVPAEAVDATGPAATWAPFTRVIVLEANGVRRVYAHPLIGERAGAAGTWTTDHAGVPITFTYHRPDEQSDKTQPPTVTVAAPEGTDVRTTHCYWFAWYAIDPDVAVAR